MSQKITGSLDGAALTIGIVVSRWNREITDGLLQGALKALDTCGVSKDRIQVVEVPGAFEIPIAVQALAETDVDSMIALGCVIKGETAHFEHVANAAMHGISEVALKYDIPVTCGILTTYDVGQAEARSRDDDDNKGVEAALAAVECANLLRELR